MNTADYLALLTALAPEVIVVLTALLVLAVDLLGLQDTPRSYRMSIAAGLTTLGCAGAVGEYFFGEGEDVCGVGDLVGEIGRAHV